MNQMSLSDKILTAQKKINYLDLFAGVKQRHTREDRENVLLAGTHVDIAASESAMLQKWRPPWYFLRVLIVGVIFSAILILCTYLSDSSTAVALLLIMFASCVVPVALMVFFWEMNVPRNISIFQLIVCFITGGLFSIVMSLWIGDATGIWSVAFLAPIAEEPGKLIIALIILKIVSSTRKDFKIYGMTGLVIGAAVGAGFAGFETAQYVYIGGLSTLYLRSLFMFASHVMFCAPYVAAAALCMKDNRFDFSFLADKRFWLIFLFSCVMHGLWNYGATYWDDFVWVLFVAELIAEWWVVLILMRDCFKQIAGKVSVTNRYSKLATDLKIHCVSGVHAGKTFALKNNDILIGTADACRLVFPLGTPGISERQCKLVIQNGAVYLADAGSQSGTYLNGERLKPLKGRLLQAGDTFWLGTEKEKFQVVR